MLTLGRRDFTANRRATFLALAGLTAYGAVLFSYYDNRSLDHVLPYVSLPALMVPAIWLGLVLDRTVTVPLRARAGALAAGLVLAAVVVATVWPAAIDRGRESLLAYSVPGGKSLDAGLDRIFDPPPIRPQAATGQKLLDRYIPGDSPVAVLTSPDLDMEILARSGRSNKLRINNASEASWVPGPHLPEIREGVDSLEAGDRMLVDTLALDAYKAVKDDPKAAFADPLPTSASSGIQPIQVRAMALIASRYRLSEVASGPDGLSVVKLVPRG